MVPHIMLAHNSCVLYVFGQPPGNQFHIAVIRDRLHTNDFFKKVCEKVCELYTFYFSIIQLQRTG